MALPVNGSTHLIPAYYSFYRPRKDKRLSWPSWLTYSGWLTHISGHLSAAGPAQDRESSLARDRRSTTVPRDQLPQTTPFSAFCTAIHSVVTGEPRDFKFGTLTYHSKSHPAEEKYSLKGEWSGSNNPFYNFTPHVISPQRLTLETSDFIHGSAM